MTALINLPRAAWKRQPQGAATIDWGNPLSRRLKFCFDATNSRAVDLAMGMSPSSFLNEAGVYSTVSRLGITKLFSGGSHNNLEYSLTNNKILSGATESTVDIYFRPKNVTQTPHTFGSWNVTSGNYWLMQQSGTNLIWVAAEDEGGNRLRWDATNLFENNYWYHLVLAWQGGGNKCAFLNGVDITNKLSTVSAVATQIRANPSQLRIGSSMGGTPNFECVFARIWDRGMKEGEVSELSENPWQLFTSAPSRLYLIPSSGGGSTITAAFSLDALIQRAGLAQSTSIDALLQSAFSRSLSIDGVIAATQTGLISLDALLQIVGMHTVSVDALLQAAKTGIVSVDALVQMTLTQAISLDALIIAASASSASTDLDAFIQALKTAGISLDALLSQSKTATAVIDALIQASKAGTVSLDAIIAGASSTTVFVGLDALIQAIQSKTLSVDALLQKTYTNPLSLDAYVALTQIKTVSLDALLQNTKTGVISLDAILQMTKTAMVSFDALIQAAKTGVISLDAILVFATQASVLLDAYVQKTLERGVGLDAIIGSIADMILPTGRVITVPASDRFVFVTHSDRVIQIQ